MSVEKSNAIVLRVTDFSETSCVVTLLTRDFGKITALAKGARRRKSPFEAAIDVLAICRIVFLHKSSNAMDLLTEAKLERRFRSASSDLNRLYSAYYVIELLRNLTEENDPHPELFDAAIRTIVALDEKDLDSQDVKLELLGFEIDALRLLGHMPMLDRCVGCGRERTTEDRVSFGLNSGGIVCRRCRPGKSNLVIVGPRSVRLLQRLMGGTQNKIDAEASGNVVREDHAQHDDAGQLQVIDEARRLISNYITHLQGFPPRLQKFLRNL